jgi:hypothetical protein
MGKKWGVKTIEIERSDVFIEALMKIQVFWDVTSCRLVSNYRLFGEAHYRHLQDQLVEMA